ncbi:MAG: esterase [Lepagella sp.]
MLKNSYISKLRLVFSNALIVSFLIILLSNYNTLAQEAIRPVSEDISSPVVDCSTGSATFSLFAPRASSVYLVGNILRNQFTLDSLGNRVHINELKMNNNEGFWSVTIPSLVPDIYCYKFVVDGVETLDPHNSYTIRDVKSVSSVCYVPGQISDLYMTKNVAHGTLRYMWYHSKFRDTDRRLMVYTPAGYETSDRYYPVLYLLHGMGGDETAWVTQGHSDRILDNLIAAGMAKEMIVVTPNGNMSRDAAPGDDILGYGAQPEFYLPNTMDGVYEEYFREIVDFVDSNFRTIPTREGRAIAGLSMGGFHSMMISINYPDLFGAVGMFSPAVIPTEFVKILPDVYIEHFEKIKALSDRGLNPFVMMIGREDFLYNSNADFRARLDTMAIPYTYIESDGGHEWSNWRRYLTDFLPLLFK